MSTTHPQARGRSKARPAGFTLVEITLVLAVLAILALVLTPAVMNFLNEARLTRTRADVSTLANGVIDFYRTTGFFPKSSDSLAGGPGRLSVDLLVSLGNIPAALGEAQGDVGRWATGTADFYANHLVYNLPNYRLRGGSPGLGLVVGTSTSTSFGWSGPYVSGAIEADPWGNRYGVNVVYLEASLGPQTATGQLKNAVFSLSAGPNGLLETPFTQPVTLAFTQGDDVAFRLQ